MTDNTLSDTEFQLEQARTLSGGKSETAIKALAWNLRVFQRRLDERRATLAQPVDIVPSHCTGTALSFDPGVLQVNKDGSGYIAIDERHFSLEDDRCEGPDGPEGSVHWITRLDASEIVALRDFLNGSKATPAQPSAGAQEEAIGYWIDWIDERRGDTARKPRFTTHQQEAFDAEMRGYRVRPVGIISTPARPAVTAADVIAYVRKWLDADDPTAWGAFERGLDRAISARPDTGDVAALREARRRLEKDADYFECPEEGAETHCRALVWVAKDIRTVLAALSKPNAPGAA